MSASSPSPTRLPGPPRLVRTLVVDDDPDILKVLRLTFSFADGVELCAEAADGREAVDAWRRHRPDVIVMDVNMPGMSGLQAAEEILAEDPAQRIVLFSAALSVADRDRAGVIGVASCCDKRDVTDLPEVVQRVAVA